jgi:hypothetical protein
MRKIALVYFRAQQNTIPNLDYLRVGKAKFSHNLFISSLLWKYPFSRGIQAVDLRLGLVSVGLTGLKSPCCG